MSQETIIANTEVSFKDFLLKNKRNRTILWIAAVAIVIQFSVFKYFYPFAGFIYGDSYVYIEAAFWNYDVDNYLVGYSWFLRLFSVFTRSDTALVAFQYLFLHGSAQYFLFTIFYFYKPTKTTQAILHVFIIFNPLFLYLCNYVSSDSIFLALSLIWFTLLLWIIHRPTIFIIVSHILTLYLAFIVRNNALIYPLVVIIAFLLSQLTVKMKVLGITSSLILIGSFIIYTGTKFRELTGIWQYSPFSGWQLANNGLYAYRYVDSSQRQVVPKRFLQLDEDVRNYFDSTRDLKKFPQEGLLASTIYMWDPKSPLHIYMNKQFNGSKIEHRKRWATMGPLYASYGIWLIKNYPSEFFRYFLWPNANKYYSPPVEFLALYNMGKDSVTQIAQLWFGYNSMKVKTRTKDKRVSVLNFYPILTGMMNVVFLCSMLCFTILKGFKINTRFRKGLFLGGSFWLTNAVFTIFASSAALRFQAFPILLVTTFGILTIDWLCKAGANADDQGSKFDAPNHEWTMINIETSKSEIIHG